MLTLVNIDEFPVSSMLGAQEDRYDHDIRTQLTMAIRPVLCLILATLSHPLLGQYPARGPSHVGPGTEYSLDARGPLPYSPVAEYMSASTSCRDDCDACDAAPCESPSRFSQWGSCSLYGAVDAVFLERTNDSYNQPLIIETNNGNTLFSTSDFDFDYQSGVRATIGLGQKGYCCLPAWEVSYLGVFDWDDAASATGDNNLSIPGDLGFAVNGFTLAERITTDYGSQLNSLETNYFGCINEVCCCDSYRRIEWLAGVRYLSLNEDFNLRGFNQNVANAVYSVDSDNNLYGAQLGSRMRAFRGYWGYELVGKAGIYGNDASQSQTIVDELGVNDVVFRHASKSGGATSFVGELGFSGLAKLTTACGVRCGYNLLWIEGLALAPDQLDFTDTAQSGTSLQRGGGTFMHGFNIGLELGW